MAVDWLNVLGWNRDQLAEFRSVAYSLVRDGFYEKAMPFFEALLSVDAASVYDNQMLGALYLQTQQYEQAVKQLNIALELDPDHLPTQLNRAKALLLSGRTEEGLKQAQQLATHQPHPVADLAEALVMAYQ